MNTPTATPTAPTELAHEILADVCIPAVVETVHRLIADGVARWQHRPDVDEFDVVCDDHMVNGAETTVLLVTVYADDVDLFDAFWTLHEHY